MNLQRLWIGGFVVLVLAAIVNVGALDVAERGFVDLGATAAWVQHTQRAENLIEHLLRLAIDAETGQRGYLLTGRDSQLERYAEARTEIPNALKDLRELTQDNPVQAAQLITVGSLLDARLEILETGVLLKRSGDEAGIAAYMQQRGGKIAMDSLRLALDGMANEERLRYDQRFKAFARNLDLVRWGFFVVAGLNLFLVTMGAAFLGQDLRRRRREANKAKERNTELAGAVLERTAELTELSHFLQTMQEDERARLAREIHDELGGTLAAAKIDLQMLSDKLAPGDTRQTRLGRAMAAIDDAVQVKRRIIEDLRPSILDNLGLGAALRWQFAEYTKRSGVPCRAELPDDEPFLAPAHSIALYRVAQEALTNISKYAGAKSVAVSLSRDDEHWILRIADDGVGIDVAQPQNPTGHGLLAMRERARALGGEFSIQRHPGGGTVVEVRLPAEKGAPTRPV